MNHHITHSKNLLAPGQVTATHTTDDGREPTIANAPKHINTYRDHEWTEHTTHHSMRGNQLHSHHKEVRLDGQRKDTHSIDGVPQVETITHHGGWTTQAKHYIGGQLSHETFHSNKFDGQGRMHEFQHTKSDGGNMRTTEHYINGQHHKTVMTLDKDTPHEVTSIKHVTQPDFKVGQWQDHASFD